MTDRRTGVEKNGEITGVDYLTGIYYPLSRLVHVSTLEPDFSEEKARYVARYCYLYGVGKRHKPPLFVSEDSLERIERARKNDIDVTIRE